MRVIITGGGDIGRITAEALVEGGHEVVLIEENMEVCERLAEEIDILVVCGDAARPDTLEKAEIDNADIVIALSGSDQMNILTALMAKEYGVKRVIVKLDDPEFNIVCNKLGVEEIVSPKIATAKHIAEMVKVPRALELTAFLGENIRVFTTLVKEEFDGKRIDALELPGTSLVIVVKRGEEFFIPGGNFKILKGDHLTILAEGKNIEALGEIFGE